MRLAGTHLIDDRRRFVALLIVAALVALPVVATAWGIAAVLTQTGSNRQLSQVLAELEARLDAPVAVDASGEVERSLLAGETVGVAGAALQAEIAAIVESVEANTVEMELLEPEEGADPGEVRLRIAFEARNDALQRILLAVEGNATALWLRSLTVEPVREAGNDADAPEPTLRAVAVIEGYWRGAAK